MRNTPTEAITQAIKIVFNAETILPFFIGSVCLGLFGNAVYDLLQSWLGDNAVALIRIALISLLILVGAIATVSWLISRQIALLPANVPFEVRQKKLEQKYPGLILLVSNPAACETAIHFHLPMLKRCWLICSRETLEKAQDLRRKFPEICVDDPIVMNDVFDPLKFRDCVDGIYRTRLPKGWSEQEVIADYTGMTAHASVGTVLACINAARPLQYTPARTDDKTGKIMGSHEPIRVMLGTQNEGRSP
ncbi:MAG: CRISPR-associated protein [Cyanobacteriota bacterium]